MIKFIRNVIIAILCVCLCIGGMFFIGEKIPYQFDRSYFGVFRIKYQKNLERTEPSIILVGGSNVAFGFDTKMISDAFDFPAYNYGFHAGLKRDFYLSAIKSNILKGDIIILAYEFSAYEEDLMNENITWSSIDGETDLVKCIPASNAFNLLRYYPIYFFTKIYHTLFDPHPMPKEDGYSSEFTNEYGDNVFERNENKRSPEYILNNAQTVIKADNISEKSCNSLRHFREYCENIGARVYLTFPSIDRLSIKEIENNGIDFKKKLEDKTGIKVISDLSDYVLDTSLFYDTDYHLNLKGVKVRTQLFIDDLKKVL